MFFRSCGCLAVVLAGSYIGFYLARRLTAKRDMLKNLILLMNETEILLGSEIMTTDSIISTLCQNADYKMLVDEFYYQTAKHSLNLSAADSKIAFDFFSVIGRFDMQTQLNLINMQKNLTLESYNKVNEGIENRCRLFRTGGILISLTVCLLLI